MPGLANQTLQDLKNDLDLQKSQKRYYEVRSQNSKIYTRNREEVERFCKNCIESITREIEKLLEEIENFNNINPTKERYFKNLYEQNKNF